MWQEPWQALEKGDVMGKVDPASVCIRLTSNGMSQQTGKYTNTYN